MEMTAPFVLRPGAALAATLLLGATVLYIPECRAQTAGQAAPGQAATAEAATAIAATAPALAGPSKDLMPLLANAAPSSAQVAIAPSTDPAKPGYVVTIQPGDEGYPGLKIPPPGGALDLSEFGHVEARITNLGTKNSTVAMRLDNEGRWQDSPWNTEMVSLKPGATATLSTIFGYAYNKKRSFPLNPAKIVNMMLFTNKSSEVQTFRVETFLAAGPKGEKPAVDPNSIRIRPEGGLLLGGKGTIDPAVQIVARNVQASLTGDGNTGPLSIIFAAAKPDQSVTLKPPVGRWNLNDTLQVRLRLKNAGATELRPRVRVDSNGGNTAWTSLEAPLAPGAGADLVIPYSGGLVWTGQKDSGPRLTSNTVSGITFSVDAATPQGTLAVESIKAEMPPQPKLPDWLGKRPPVEGDWVQTLNDNFDGNAVDPTVWNIQGPNFWDKPSHWSRDNVLVGGGVVKLRYEKKTGKHNDAPDGKETPYTAGYLDSYGKWVQRYGYFEARMKLPTAAGLWPAFWMMPDRGVAAGEQWKRADTANGGMEFDIMEHLTRWGPNRYNVAMHYDGYGKGHKALGTDKIYMHPDKDGFITCGLLWTPGSAVYYANGIEVGRWDDPRVSNVTSNFLFTLPQGGWDNDPIDDAALPADFIIDYVRVWQRKDLAQPTDGKQPQPTP